MTQVIGYEIISTLPEGLPSTACGVVSRRKNANKQTKEKESWTEELDPISRG